MTTQKSFEQRSHQSLDISVEPILAPNRDRFVILPIRHDNVWQMYKKAEASFWTAEGMNPINFEYVKEVLSDNISRFLFQRTNKRPIVIPVLIGV
jgi:hypothetical protein